MRHHRGGPTGSRWAAIAVVVAAAAACGGGDDDASAGDGDQSGAVSDVDEPPAGAAGGGDADTGGGAAGAVGVVLGDPPSTADPGQVWVEVGGERLEYTTGDALAVECSITPERVTVNLQTADGRSFLLQGADDGGSWFLNLTFSPGGGDEQVSYGSESASGRGTYTIGDGALSYDGTVIRVVDFDVANGEELDARLAVNCASPGGDPTAVVGGETYAFPVSGAQSVQCQVSPEAIDVRINRLALEGRQLELSVRLDGDAWLGTVTVYRNEGNLSSLVPPDGAGLTVDGTSVTYVGTFEGPDGAQLDGSVEVTC